MVRSFSQASRGSPPLVRERLDGGLYEGLYFRITPARAGKTCRSVNRGCIFRDHPRSCGKDDDTITFLQVNRGSPPLVRERLVQDIVRGPNRGITPACAGKTVRAGNRLREPRDHPRSCGKDGQHHHDRNRRRGSPPLVRERPMMWMPYCSCKGITPARAGKTFINNLQGSLGKDHPRSCGKDFSGDGPVLLQIGSPPLVRERLVPHHNVGHVGRITPARAGKTLNSMNGFIIAWDHPRSCGKDIC